MGGYNKAYALIIGVGDDLPMTVKDADTIAAFLANKEQGAFNPDNIYLHTEKDATPQAIFYSLRKLVKKSKFDPDAPIYIYYSGHGAIFDDDYYLLLNGYDEYDKEGTMLHGSDLAEMINEISSNKLLVLLDCCHADGMNNKRDFLRSKVSGRPIIGSLEAGQGRVFLSSCDDNELSLTTDGDNSLFTKILLEALNGANSGTAEEVHVIDVLSHILKNVPGEANKLKEGHKQTPVISEVKKLDSNFFICPNALKDQPMAAGIADKEGVIKNYFTTQKLVIEKITGPTEIKADKIVIEKIEIKGYEYEVEVPVDTEGLKLTGQEFKEQQMSIKDRYMPDVINYKRWGIGIFLLGLVLFVIFDFLDKPEGQVMAYIKWFATVCGPFIGSYSRVPFARVQNAWDTFDDTQTQILRIRSFPKKAFAGINYLMETAAERKRVSDIQNAIDTLLKKDEE